MAIRVFAHCRAMIAIDTTKSIRFSHTTPAGTLPTEMLFCRMRRTCVNDPSFATERQNTDTTNYPVVGYTNAPGGTAVERFRFSGARTIETACCYRSESTRVRPYTGR